MNRISTCILACAFTLAIASPAAFAGARGLPQIAEQPAAQDPHRELLQALAAAAGRRHHTHHVARRAPRVKVHNDDLDKIMQVNASQRPAHESRPRRIVAIDTRKADAREAAEREARTNNLYRSSQLSAPIIKDAKACKRIGAHGESIYENC